MMGRKEREKAGKDLRAHGQCVLSEIWAIREEGKARKPGILGVLCWPICTPKASTAPVLGLWTTGEGPQNAASELVQWGKWKVGGTRLHLVSRPRSCSRGPQLRLLVSH